MNFEKKFGIVLLFNIAGFAFISCKPDDSKSNEVLTVSIPSPRSMFEEMDRFVKKIGNDTVISWGPCAANSDEIGFADSQFARSINVLERKINASQHEIEKLHKDLLGGVISTSAFSNSLDRIKSLNKEVDALLEKTKISLDDLKKTDKFEVAEEIKNERYKVEIELPGYTQDEVKTTLEEVVSNVKNKNSWMILKVVAIKKVETEKKETVEKHGTKSFMYQKFSSSWSKVEPLSSARKVKKDFRDGVFTITVELPVVVQQINLQEVEMNFKDNKLVVDMPLGKTKNAKNVIELKYKN